MRSSSLTELYFDAIVHKGMYSNVGNLQFHMETLFEGIDLRNKRILDIGGGNGLYSYYAASQGASEVVCLEPEAEGSNAPIAARFRDLGASLRLKTAILLRETIQGYESRGRQFDIVLLHNSINHLNESACITLLTDRRSMVAYRDIFAKISGLSTRGAKLIVCDCSCDNFFAALGLRNPIARSIEWQKHQTPETWINLLSGADYVNPRVRWTSFNSLRTLGRAIMGNRFVSYFLTSHFCLTMEKA